MMESVVCLTFKVDQLFGEDQSMRSSVTIDKMDGSWSNLF